MKTPNLLRLALNVATIRQVLGNVELLSDRAQRNFPVALRVFEYSFIVLPFFSFLFYVYRVCVCARAHHNTCGGQRMIQLSTPVTSLPLPFLCVFRYFA